LTWVVWICAADSSGVVGQGLPKKADENNDLSAYVQGAVDLILTTDDGDSVAIAFASWPYTSLTVGQTMATGIWTLSSGGQPQRPPPGKALGSCSCSKGQPQTGDPITVGTGNVFEQAQDYTTTGPNPLSFTRYYNSMGAVSNPGPFAISL
jgi:hypothetical protein